MLLISWEETNILRVFHDQNLDYLSVRVKRQTCKYTRSYVKYSRDFLLKGQFHQNNRNRCPLDHLAGRCEECMLELLYTVDVQIMVLLCSIQHIVMDHIKQDKIVLFWIGYPPPVDN